MSRPGRAGAPIGHGPAIHCDLMHTQSGDPHQGPDAAFACFVADCLSHWKPAVLLAALMAAGTWMGTSLSGSRGTVSFLMAGPTEPIEGMSSPADTAQFLGSLDINRINPEVISLSARADRGATLVSVVARLRQELDERQAAEVPQAIVERANAAIAGSLEAARAALRDSLSSRERSLAEAEQMLAKLGSGRPIANGEAAATVLGQVVKLREDILVNRQRLGQLRGVRAVGAPELAIVRADSSRATAAAAAGLGGLVLVPILLRFGAQVGDARRRPARAGGS